MLVYCVSCYGFQKIATYLTLRRASAGNAGQQPVPGTSCHLHTSVKSRIALKIIHDNAMVTADDMLVDALPAKMFKDFVDAINAIQNRLERQKQSERSRHSTASQATTTCLKTALTQKPIHFQVSIAVEIGYTPRASVFFILTQKQKGTFSSFDRAAPVLKT